MEAVCRGVGCECRVCLVEISLFLVESHLVGSLEL
jgi:hypothetical protein